MTTPPSAITRPPVEIFGRHSGYGFAGLGVSTAIGNFTQTAIDLAFPAGLLGLLDWQRTYNSHSGAVGALGPGWSTSFSASLVVGTSGLLHHAAGPVTFNDEDGRVLTFTPDQAGGFTGPQDLKASLARSADGTFSLTYNSGELWSFDSSGRLTGRSLEGQQVTLSYNDQDLLAGATHSSGRSLTFSYDANRRLTSVAADDSRVASFGYGTGTVSDSLLQTATVPGGGVFRFEYSGSGQASQIAQITNPDGNLVVTNSYDASTSQVTSQQFSTGGGAAFAYDAAAGVTTVTSTPSGATVVFQADANGRVTKVTDPDGNAATFSYDGNGYLAVATTPGGTQLTETHDANGNLLTRDFGGSATAWTYDAADRVSSMTNPVGNVTSYEYAGTSRIPSQVTGPDGNATLYTVANGLVTSRTDADGNTTTYGYDAASNLVSVGNALGSTQFGYDAAGSRTQLITPSGATTQWSYDGAGRVTSSTNAEGAVTAFQYTAAGLLSQQTDATGASVSYAYDAAGNLTSVTDALGRTSTFSYDADGNLAATANPLGEVTQYGYDALSRLTSITDPVGEVTTFGYDADGNNVTEASPAGTTQTSYDARGNPLSVTDPTQATAHYEYDGLDRLTAATDAVGGTWRLGYNEAGFVASVADPTAASTALAWTPAGLLTTGTDPLGRRTSYTRDASGVATQVTDPASGVTQYAYDSDGRTVSKTTPAGLTTKFGYDQAGRVVATTDPRGWITRTVYNPRGDKVAVISPSGVVTRFRYDAAGQLTQTVDGNGNVTEFGYDNAGRLISATDAKGAVTLYAYDAKGRLVSVTDPLGRTTTRAYDAAGNLVTITDPAGQAQHMTYDADGRLTQWTASGAEVTFGYDAAGRRVSMTDATGTTHYTYDAAGRVLTVTEPDGTQIVSGYDVAGQRTSLTYPGGLTVSYGYDPNGRLTAMHDSRAGYAAYAVDPDGRLLTEQLPDRLARRYHYEAGLLHRFLAIRDGHPVSEATFTYDPDGRILTQQETERSWEFRYDPVGQLVYARSGEDGELHFGYDAVGNRVLMRHRGVETHYRYDDADQLTDMQSQGRHVESRYDASGRLTEEIDGEYRRVIGYNGFGWPVSVIITENGAEETVKTVFTGDGLAAELVLTNTDERRAEERAASVRYLWNNIDQIPQILAQRAATELDDAEHSEAGRLSADFAYGYGRTFASWEHGAAAFHRDADGSAVRTDETAAWTVAERYGIFGVPEEPRRDPDPRQGPERRPEREPRRGPEPRRDREPRRDHELRPPELPRFGYRGELTRGPVIDLRARVYDAALGRFTSRDPVSTTTAAPYVNPYAYANNDPVNLIDPLGTLAFSIAPFPGVPRTATPSPSPGSPPPASPISVPAEIFKAAPAAIVAGVLTRLLYGFSSVGPGGPDAIFGVLHTEAAWAAAGQLIVQMMAKYGLSLSEAWDGMGLEVPINGASKSRTGNTGYADILFLHANTGYIWEVKYDQVGGGPTEAADVAADEVKNYTTKYVQQYPGRQADPGDPLTGPVDLPDLAGAIRVYSLTQAVTGALLWGDTPKPPGVPFPVPFLQKNPVPQPTTQPQPARNPFHFKLPLPGGGHAPLPGPASAAGGLFAALAFLYYLSRRGLPGPEPEP